MAGTKDYKKGASIKSDGALMSRQKVLLPTLKERQRYVVYKMIADAKDASSTKGALSSNALTFNASTHNDIISQCNSMLGIFDGGKAGLVGVKYNPDKMTGIIRVSNNCVDKLKVCMGLIREINGVPVAVDCIYVSGMLNKAMERMDIRMDIKKG